MSNKSNKQNLAIALAVSKRKKMAKGGDVKGVNEAVKAPGLKGGMSKAGLNVRQSDHPALKDHPLGEEARQEAKAIHREKLEELKAMPKPKLPMADGGEVKKPKLQPLKQPSMVKSSVFTTKLRDEMPEPEAKVEHSLDYNELRKEFIDKKAKMRRMAEGGDVEEMGPEAEEDMGPKMSPLDHLDDEETPAVDEYMASRMADGGMLDDEMEEESHASIAAAIMAKRRRMAEGGEVDIEENEEEQPNSFYHQNEDAALKEDYDSDFEDLEQPEDSNEMGDEAEASEEDDMGNSIVSKIRRKMKAKSPITK